MTGICTFQGLGAGQPEIAYGSIVDYYAASMLAFGVSSALLCRERSGKGQYVGVSLLRSALAMQSARFIWADSEERNVERDMRSGGVTGIHPTREGSLYLSANTPHFWNALCELVGLPTLAADPRYDSVRKRAEAAAGGLRQRAVGHRGGRQHFGRQIVRLDHPTGTRQISRSAMFRSSRTLPGQS